MNCMFLRALAIGVSVGFCGLNANKEFRAYQELVDEGKISKPIFNRSYTIPTLNDVEAAEYQREMLLELAKASGIAETIFLPGFLKGVIFYSRNERDAFIFETCDRNKQCRNTHLKPFILAMNRLQEKYYLRTYISDVVEEKGV